MTLLLSPLNAINGLVSTEGLNKEKESLSIYLFSLYSLFLSLPPLSAVHSYVDGAHESSSATIEFAEHDQITKHGVNSSELTSQLDHFLTFRFSDLFRSLVCTDA